jgi:diguanylate cyclase (GGDEF)-like protein
MPATDGFSSPDPPRHDHRRWRISIALIVALGIVAAMVSGLMWRDSVRRTDRQAFDTASVDVANTAEDLIRGDVQLLLALRAGLAEHPHVIDSHFKRYFDELQAPHYQVGGLGTVVVQSVPHSSLGGFLRARDSDPAFRRLVGGNVLPVLGGRSSHLCLLVAGVPTDPYDRATSELLQGDWCSPASAIGAFRVDGGRHALQMRRIAAEGGFRVAPVAAAGRSTFFLEAAYYRPGAPLHSPAQREASLLGWVSSSFSIPALAKATLAPHHNLSVDLYQANPGGPLRRLGGAGTVRHAAFTSSESFGLAGRWVVKVQGSPLGGSLSASIQGVLVGLTVLVVTGLVALLVMILGRSRERALGLVDRKTGELRHQALHDALTGLPNRILALDRAKYMLARSRREQLPVAALFIDIDGFKHVNDTFGHAAGDELLRQVAQRLRSIVRESDTAARLGGDEFVVLVEGATLSAGPELLAERLLEVLRQPYDLGGEVGRELSMTASIGVAWGLRESADELLRDADLALYQAKDAGRNCYVSFKSTMQTAARDRAELEMDLAGALDRDELFLLYQPTIDLHTQLIIGVEALIRWRHPDRGVIEPDRFIPLAEESGLVVPIGAWVLQEACKQAAAWHREGHELGVAVNVSARQLDTAGLLGDVRAALRRSGLPAGSLTLEITETALMRDPEQTAARLRALKALGVRIAIDDFGTGYSSLAYLRQFPADALKIDRSFIDSIGDSQQSKAIIHTLVRLGKALNIETLAEGIEDRDQLHALQSEDCDLGQGFLFSRPVPPEQIEGYLRSGCDTTEPLEEGGAPARALIPLNPSQGD